METPIADLVPAAAVLRNVAFFLLLAAVAMPTLLLVRLTALAAGVALIVLAAIRGDDPAALFWGILFAAVGLGLAAIALRERWGGPFRPEEQLFHERVVPGLDRARARRLLAAGQWRDVAAGTTLTREGERTAELCFVSRGTVEIMTNGRKVADVGVGGLVGEVGLSTGDPATATAVCATPVRYLGFAVADLYRVLDGNVDLQDAVELAIQRSLRDKLHHANAARVQAAGD